MYEDFITPSGQAQLYLRMLHSASFAEQLRAEFTSTAHTLPDGLRALIATVDFERLRAEHDHRIGDFCTYLAKACPLHKALVEEAMFCELAGAYCDSPDFVSFRGRTLAENYALWGYRWLVNRGEGFLAEVLRIEGVASGLGHTLEAQTPWAEHRRLKRTLAEVFISKFDVFDADLEAADLSVVVERSRRSPSPTLVCITRHPDGRIFVTSRAYQRSSS